MRIFVNFNVELCVWLYCCITNDDSNENYRHIVHHNTTIDLLIFAMENYNLVI